MRNDYMIFPQTQDKIWSVRLHDPDAERTKAMRRGRNCLKKWLCMCVPDCLSKLFESRAKTHVKTATGLGQSLLHSDIVPLRLKEKDHAEVSEKEHDLWRGAGADFLFNEDGVDSELTGFKDDGLSELQIEQYLQSRLSPLLRDYNKRAQFLGRFVKTSQVFMTLLTGGTTFLAAIKEVDLRFLVPLMVALNAMVAQCSEYERFPTRLVNVRKSIEELTGLQVWWSGLTGTEQRQKANFFKLVTKTEEQANAEISAWKKSSAIESDGGEEKKDDEKKS